MHAQFRSNMSAGVILIGAAVAAESWLKDDKLVASEKKVHEIQPSRDEKRFDEIGWAPSFVLAAEALAKNQPPGVPVYLQRKDRYRPVLRRGIRLESGSALNPTIIDL